MKINGLFEEKDLAVVVTRESFEALVKPLLNRLTAPIAKALDFAQVEGGNAKKQYTNRVMCVWLCG